MALADLPDSCAGGVPSPCYRLGICAETADCADDDFPPNDMPVPDPDNYYVDGAVYARVLHKGEAVEDGSGDPWVGVHPFRSRLTSLVQYWFFYEYDEWVRPVVVGKLRQRHEADWESVTIGLGADEPLFIAYSAHCGGRWHDWDEVDLVPIDHRATEFPASFRRPIRLNHPLIGVAEGSQANYNDTAEERAPDWTGCRGVGAGTGERLSYIVNLRDRTGADLFILPRQILLVDARTPPMSFPGIWGGRDSTALNTWFDKHTIAHGQGPVTPSHKPIWRTPLQTIFCSDTWRPRRCRD